MPMYSKLLFFLICLITPTLQVHAATPELSLDEYLNQVRSKHLGVEALKQSSEGAFLRSQEGGLLTSPYLFAGIQVADDKKPTSNPAFMGSETAFQGYSLGVQEQFGFGLNAKLSYTLNYTKISGATPAFLPIPNFYEARPMLELTQSLLRNGFGRETRATETLATASAKAQGHVDSFKMKSLLAEAESTYWSLSLSRELVQVQAESVERAKKIKEWNSRRAKVELADKADYLQSEAGLQARLLEHQIAQDEQARLERAFNRIRGSESTKVEEKLKLPNKETLEKVAIPEKKGSREDLLAAEEYRRAAEANAQIGREKNLPTLDLTGTIALNGRSDVLGTATGDASKTQYPTYGIGLKLVAPLAFGTVADNREGYAKETKAAELNYQRKLFEEKQDWNELVMRIEESTRRLRMTNDIERAQDEKLKNERERLKRGRSVTYQVLLFEQDFAQAQALRIRTEAEILTLLAQVKLFGDSK